MNEYILIAILYLLGVGYHVMQKIAAIRVKFPEAPPSMVFSTFLREEWNTLIVSALGLITIEIFWVIAHNQGWKLPDWIHNWGGIYLLAIVSGYSLQRFVYKLLGTAEGVISRKVEQMGEK